ncbi:MAG: hypothetical protein IPK80_11220 [Nannocystis sp.]|nr:hypothetical protein [Nannocystis sp.]
MSVDKLVERASAFKKGVSEDRTVTTKVIVKPYQVAANQPSNAKFLDLFEQRKVLAELAQRFEDFDRAGRQIKEILGGAKCTDPKKRRSLEQAETSYESSMKSIRERAKLCLNEPESGCTTRRLDTLDRGRHEKVLVFCTATTSLEAQKQPARGGIRKIEAPPRVKGVDVPCGLWQLSQVAITIAPSKADGAPWDADGSPPDVSTRIRVDSKSVGTIAQRSTYDVSKSLDGLFVRPSQTIEVRLVDSDAMFDDAIANLSAVVPTLLPDGKITLQSGRTRALFSARCVE